MNDTRLPAGRMPPRVEVLPANPPVVVFLPEAERCPQCGGLTLTPHGGGWRCLPCVECKEEKE